MKRFTVPNTTSHFVGLITIETLPVDPWAERPMQTEREDATLQQILLHLATGGASSPEREMLPSRFHAPLALRWQASTRLGANLDHLSAQLQLALACALGEIAAGS